MGVSEEQRGAEVTQEIKESCTPESACMCVDGEEEEEGYIRPSCYLAQICSSCMFDAMEHSEYI